MEDLRRYSVELSDWDNERVVAVTNSLNRLGWKFHPHFFDRVGLRFDDQEIRLIAAFLKDLVLKPEQCFEYYVNQANATEKVVYQVPFGRDQLLKLVITSQKKVLSVWSNHVNHVKKLNPERYEKKGDLQHASL